MRCWSQLNCNTSPDTYQVDSNEAGSGEADAHLEQLVEYNKDRVMHVDMLENPILAKDDESHTNQRNGIPKGCRDKLGTPSIPSLIPPPGTRNFFRSELEVSPIAALAHQLPSH